MPHIPTREYLRRRELMPATMTPEEVASWWDDPCAFTGRDVVSIGGKAVFVDYTLGSVPTVTKRVS